MKRNWYDPTLTESATVFWPLEESPPWSSGSGKPRRRAAEKAERRAMAAARRIPTTALTKESSPKSTDRHGHDSAISRASGWFFLPPHG